ncbi:Odorant receptor 423, partial [Nylanderia fulva]
MDPNSIFRTRYYSFSRILMKFVGIWPYHTTTSKVLIFVILLPLSITTAYPQGRYLVQTTNINDLFKGLTSMVLTIIITYQLVIMTMYHAKIKVCFKRIEDDWLSLKTDIEKTILQRHTEYGQYLSKVYAALITFTPVSYLLKPVIMTLIESENSTTPSLAKLPYYVDYGEKWNDQFALLMLHCSVAIVIHSIIIVTINSFYYAAIQHACGMFAIIG